MPASRRTRRWARRERRSPKPTIDAAETALFLAKVPPSAAEVHGGGRGHLFGVAADSAVQRIPDGGRLPGLRAIVDGTVGKIKDFFVFRSQFVQKTGSSPVTTHNMAFTKDALGLVIRRLPQPLPGTGAIAEYAELGNFGMRVVMSYQPNTLAQQFTVDVLYGCGVLRDVFGRAGQHVGRWYWRCAESAACPYYSELVRASERSKTAWI